MALKSVYDTIDNIPQEHQALYSEAPDGRFVLDIEDVDNHPRVRGVVTANKTNAQKAQERLAALEAANARLANLPEDFDPEEWTRLKSQGGKPDEQLNAIREQHQRAIAAEKAKAQAERDALQAQLQERDSYIDGQARRDALNAALDATGFDPIHKPMLTKFLADQIKVRRADDGSRVAYAETDLGDLSPVEFVKEFAGKDGKAYLAKASGPSAPGNNGTITRGLASGNIGGTKAERVGAIAAKHPDLPLK